MLNGEFLNVGFLILELVFQRVYKCCCMMCVVACVVVLVAGVVDFVVVCFHFDGSFLLYCNLDNGYGHSCCSTP